MDCDLFTAVSAPLWKLNADGSLDLHNTAAIDTRAITWDNMKKVFEGMLVPKTNDDKLLTAATTEDLYKAIITDYFDPAKKERKEVVITADNGVKLYELVWALANVAQDNLDKRVVFAATDEDCRKLAKICALLDVSAQSAIKRASQDQFDKMIQGLLT